MPAAGGVQEDSAIPKDRALVHPSRDGRDGRQVVAPLRARTGDLLQQDRRADAAPARRVERVLDRDVVVHEHRLDRDAVIGGVLGRELEVHHVARVVLDDVDHSGAAVDRLGRGEHLLRDRRGEDLAGARGVEHALADEAAVQRLVPRAAA